MSIKRKVLLKWIIVDDFCSCLIFENGNPDNVEDRVAFIEKTPRVFINGKWVQGSKGSGGNLIQDGFSIYGFYQPSRDWCEKMILENYDICYDNSLLTEFNVNRYYLNKFLREMICIDNFELFLNTFYFQKELIDFSFSSVESASISLPSIVGNTKEEFLSSFDKRMALFRTSLEKDFDKIISEFDSITSIKKAFNSGSIYITGNKTKQGKHSLLDLFEKSLKETKVATVYKGIVQNNIDSDNVVIFNYRKDKNLLTFEYKGITFFTKVDFSISHNFGHSLRKILAKDNFYDILNIMFSNFRISIIK